MPCSDGREDAWREAHTPKMFEDQAKELEKLTRLLCEASNKLAQTGHLYELSKELQQWHKEHQKVDASRAKKGK